MLRPEHTSKPEELRGDAPLNPVHITLTSPTPFIIILSTQTLSNPRQIFLHAPCPCPWDGLGAAGDPIQAGWSPAPGPGVSLCSSALIHLHIPGSTALLLIRSRLGGLGCAPGCLSSVLGFGSCSGDVLHTTPIMSSSCLAHTHLPHLVTVGISVTTTPQKKSKGGWCPQILPLSGLSSTAPSPASPHLPPAPSGPNFPTVSLSSPLLKAELPLHDFLTLGRDPLGGSGWRYPV